MYAIPNQHTLDSHGAYSQPNDTRLTALLFCVPGSQVWTYHNQVAVVVSVIDSHEVYNQHVAKQLLQQSGLRPGTPSAMRPSLSAQQQQLLSQVRLHKFGLKSDAFV